MSIFIAISFFAYIFYYKKTMCYLKEAEKNIDLSNIVVQQRKWMPINYYDDQKDLIIVDQELSIYRQVRNYQLLIILYSIREHYLAYGKKTAYLIYKFLSIFLSYIYYPIILAMLVFIINGDETLLGLTLTIIMLCSILIIASNNYINQISSLSKLRINSLVVEEKNKRLLLRINKNYTLVLLLELFTSYGKSLHILYKFLFK